MARKKAARPRQRKRVRDQENPTPKDRGGLGGLTDGIRDTRLIARAITKRWNIPQAKRQRLIDRQIQIATSKRSSDRAATSAFKSIVAAEAQNMEQERRELQIPDFHEHSVEAVVAATVQVVEIDDWYGSRPAKTIDPAAGDGTPAQRVG